MGTGCDLGLPFALVGYLLANIIIEALVQVLNTDRSHSFINRDRTFYWHYAWVIVAIIAGMQIVGSSMRMAFGAFIDPLEEQFKWSQGGIGFAYALHFIVSALVSPWAGNIGDRLGAKKSMLVGTAVFFIGMVMTAYITELWHFWVTFGVILGLSLIHI